MILFDTLGLQSKILHHRTAKIYGSVHAKEEFFLQVKMSPFCHKIMASNGISPTKVNKAFKHIDIIVIGLLTCKV